LINFLKNPRRMWLYIFGNILCCSLLQIILNYIV